MRSTLVPGWGQMATNRRVLGKTLLFVWGLLAIVALTVFIFVEPMELAIALADPEVLLGLVGLNILLAAVRLFSTGHAWRAGGGYRWFAGVLLAVIVAIPHVAIAWVGLETRDSLVTVFPPTPIPPPVVATMTTSSTIHIELAPIDATPGQYGEDVLNVTKTAPWRPFGESRLNILLLGGDAGPGRGGLRTDTMIVASIDPVSGDAALIGVPRNYGDVTLSDGTKVPVSQLGHTYGWGVSHSDRFGGVDPGASAVLDAVAYVTGLDIDYFVLVDLTGFADLVDALGGIKLDVPLQVDGPLYNPLTGGYEMIRILPGEQTLDGAAALAYARARHGSSDYARMSRQRCILAALATQTNPLELLAHLGDVLSVVKENVTTDISVDEVPDLVRLLLQVDSRRISLIGFDATWSRGFTTSGHPIPDVERIRATVRQVVEGSSDTAAMGVKPADEACA